MLPSAEYMTVYPRTEPPCPLIAMGSHDTFTEVEEIPIHSTDVGDCSGAEIHNTIEYCYI